MVNVTWCSMFHVFCTCHVCVLGLIPSLISFCLLFVLGFRYPDITVNVSQLLQRHVEWCPVEHPVSFPEIRRWQFFEKYKKMCDLYFTIYYAPHRPSWTEDKKDADIWLRCILTYTKIQFKYCIILHRFSMTNICHNIHYDFPAGISRVILRRNK